MEIPYTMTNVAETVVGPINADATLSAGGANNQLIFAGLVISQKGQPFELISINKDNYQSKLGKPYHPNKGVIADSMRNVAEAVPGGSGLVVRVVPDDAKYPIIRIKSADGKAFTAETDALPFATAVTLDDDAGEKLAIYIVDGAKSDDRSIEFKLADESMYGAGMYELVVYQKDQAGHDAELEKFLVSMDPEATDDMGQPSYIETVLENQAKTVRAVVGDIASITAIEKTAFSGGTEGDLSNLSAENYAKALSRLNASVVRFTNVLGLGIYNTDVIKGLIDIANRRRIGGFFDIDPRLSFEAAAKAKEDLGLNEHRACFYHLPFDSIDPTYKCRAVWGLSGTAFRAKAAGVRKSSPVGGWHYTPAGMERAMISRTGLRQLPSAGEPDYERMYKCRLNKVATNAAGLLFIDDSLTSSVRETYLRFEQIVSVSDAISRDYYALANSLKHQPDGVTYDGIVEGMTDILDGYVSTGALVPPTDEADGTEPYKLFVEKVDKDAWRVRWAISVTGSARRFIGEPMLLK